jgi:hypothetical protein
MRIWIYQSYFLTRIEFSPRINNIYQIFRQARIKKLSEQDKTANEYGLEPGTPGALSREVLDGILKLPGSEALNKILDQENTIEIVRDISLVDFFWLIKKIGEDDALPLLRLASDDQWQYIMDMELWHRDRIGTQETFKWLDRFHKSDPEKLARWLYSEEGNLLAHYFFDNVLEVKIKEEQDYIPPDGFFTFDDLYYISIPDKENEDEIKQMLMELSSVDYNRFQALLLGLAGVIPAEVEEELYRLKSIRMAEVGYLPFEEAISIYSYQRPDMLKQGGSDYKMFFPDEETMELVPLTPLSYAGGDNIFTKSVAAINDNLSMERLRLEFAGLCNQIFSADAVLPEGIDDLVKVTKKAAGYLNIGLQKLSDGNLQVSEDYVRNNPLVSIFRVGFGASLELKWETEKKMKGAWFLRNGLDAGFWGDEWGGVLKGILMKIPLCYKGEYRPFEDLKEVDSARAIVAKLALLDRTMEEISNSFNLRSDMLQDPLITFHTLLFHSWAIKKLDLKQNFVPLSLSQAKDFFRLVRGEGKRPPYKMSGSKQTFIDDLLSLVPEIETDDKSLLNETLEGLWEEFVEEYAMLDVSLLDPRFTKYIIIDPSLDTKSE